MTLSQIIYRVGELAVRNPRLDLDFLDIINEAQREIADRKNWTFMHNRSSFTIPVNSSNVSLGATFKELSPEVSPISYTYGVYNLPVSVMSREEIERLGYWPLTNQFAFTPTPGGNYPYLVVFLEQNGPGGAWTLNIPPQFSPTINLSYNVSGFFYPADLALGTDHNSLTDHATLQNALINLARALALESDQSIDPDGKRAMRYRQLYEAQFETANYADSERKYSGRLLRM